MSQTAPVALLSLRSRAFGLLPGSSARQGAYALFAPCKDVHTFGMEAPIDIAFADAHGMVLESWRAVEPNTRRRCARATMTVERMAMAPDAPWFEVGQSIFALPEEGRLGL